MRGLLGNLELASLEVTAWMLLTPCPWHVIYALIASGALEFLTVGIGEGQ